MDLASPKCFQAPLLFPSNGEPGVETNASLYGQSNGNPFADTFSDPLCKLNLKETSEFVKSLPMAASNTTTTTTTTGLDVSMQRRRGVNSVTTQRRVLETPCTPGRPVFSFSGGNLARKSFPSKWDDAEKWLISSSCHESPAHTIKSLLESSKVTKQCDNFKQQAEVFAEKSRVTEEKITKVVKGPFSLEHHNPTRGFSGIPGSTDVFLKGNKFTDEVEPILPNFRCSEPSREGFLFRNSVSETMTDAGTEMYHDVKHKDAGTEMTPLGSSTTSRCHTPCKSSSPARHNTPANRSGPLRHFETGSACRKSVSDSRTPAWEEEERTKCCLRYRREEAKIQAWVNLQNAKAEAQSRKLEVKIQKMRSKLEEKLMKRMAVVHRKAEEWRASAQQQHAEQMQKPNNILISNR
ncbi:hypothetical protein Godav_022745, partial [Gossypium davidsonii]|nr:hypothetical protein [Gossypium davidsonii]